MRKHIRTICGLVCLVVWLGFATQVHSLETRIEAPKKEQCRIIIPVYGPDEMTLVSRHLRAGDMVVLYPPRPELKASGLPQQPEHWIQMAKEFKAKYPKVEVIFNFDGIDELREWTPKLPKEIEWVSYDYEKWEWTPEYGPSQEHTLRYFEEARRIVHKHKKRLFLTPVPFFNDYAIGWALKGKYLSEKMRAWDFASIAAVGEAFNAQFQYFYQDTDWLESTVRAMSADLQRKSPKTLFFVQLGPGPKARPIKGEDVKKAADTVCQVGADGVVLWFGPGASAWGAGILPLIRGDQ